MFSGTPITAMLNAVTRSEEAYATGQNTEPMWYSARADWSRAVAEDLLPAVLGGEWRQAKHAPNTIRRGRFGGLEYEPIPQLFDHRTRYRMRGTSGPATWANTVLAAEPYRWPIGDLLSMDFIEDYHRLAKAFNVGVWAARHLSVWYPGKTTLVLVGRGLLRETARKFGFTRVAGR